jgi:hypothetical protein
MVAAAYKVLCSSLFLICSRISGTQEGSSGCLGRAETHRKSSLKKIKKQNKQIKFLSFNTEWVCYTEEGREASKSTH